MFEETTNGASFWKGSFKLNEDAIYDSRLMIKRGTFLLQPCVIGSVSDLCVHCILYRICPLCPP